MNNKKLFTLLGVLLLLPIFSNAQLLYKVSGNGLEKPSYIFGTHHLFSISFADSVPGFHEALAACEQVFGEVAMDNHSMQEMENKMRSRLMMPSDTTYKDIMSPKDYNFLNQQIKKYLGEHFGMEQLSTLKPATISMQLSMIISQKVMGIDVRQSFEGIDSRIQTIARERGLHVGGLESIESQLQLLFGESLADQARSLIFSLKTGNLEKDTEQMITMYRNNDSKSLYGFMNENIRKSSTNRAEYIHFKEVMLNKRNVSWAKQLSEIFKKGATFVAVGAGHLHGEQGLIVLLQNRGYVIEPVQ